MRLARANLVGILVGLSAVIGCAHPAYGPSSDARLDTAVKEGGTENKLAGVSADQIQSKRCTNYRDRLAKAKNDDVKEEDRIDNFIALYKDLKDKNDYLEQALASNPDLQFQQDSQIPKIKDECVQALADVRQDYYAFIADVTDLLVVKDTHGNPAPRLDFKKLREAINVLDPDDRDTLLARVDAADRRVKSRE